MRERAPNCGANANRAVRADQASTMARHVSSSWTRTRAFRSGDAPWQSGTAEGSSVSIRPLSRLPPRLHGGWKSNLARRPRWAMTGSNLLELPRNEPETWRVAGELLPHALKAVRQAYSGAAPTVSAEQPADLPPPVEMAQPIRTLVAGARQYFEESRAKFERTCFVVMPFGLKRLEDGRQLDFEDIYRELFSPAIQAVGLDAVRVDQDLFVGEPRRFTSIGLHRTLKSRLTFGCD